MKPNRVKDLLAKPLVRFLLVGVVNTLIGLSVTYGSLHMLHFSYWEATCSGNSVGAVISYFLNKRITFNNRENVARTFVLFVCVILACYVISFYIGLQVVQAARTLLPGWNGELAKDAAILFSTGLYTGLNYIGQKIIVFRGTEKQYEAVD